MRHKIRHRRRRHARARARQYVYLPFEVPPGARRIEVNYYYDNQVHGRAGDEPRQQHRHRRLRRPRRGLPDAAASAAGAAAPAPASTSSREAATPGYLRGPLQAGRVEHHLRLLEDRRPVVRYRVNVEVDVDPSRERDDAGTTEVPVPGDALHAGSAERLPNGAARAGRWYRGDLHAHSEHSDGANTVDEIVDYTPRRRPRLLRAHRPQHHQPLGRPRAPQHRDVAAAHPRRGDHDVRRPRQRLGPRRLDRLPRHATPSKVRALVEDANRRGSMFSINHPDSPIPWLHDAVRGYQAVEVWNAPWRWYNEPALLRWEDHLEARRAHGRRRRQRLALRAARADDAAERPRRALHVGVRRGPAHAARGARRRRARPRLRVRSAERPLHRAARRCRRRRHIRSAARRRHRRPQTAR